MTDDLEILKEALAKGPTPGPWSAFPNLISVQKEHEDDYGMTQLPDSDADREFIAACSPDRIQRLVERVEAYEKALEKYVHCGHACTNCTTTKVASAVLAKYAKQGDGG